MVHHIGFVIEKRRGSFVFVETEGLQSWPPAYCDTMELPTYDECIRAKLIEEAETQETQDVVNSQHLVDVIFTYRFATYCLLFVSNDPVCVFHLQI